MEEEIFKDEYDDMIKVVNSNLENDPLLVLIRYGKGRAVDGRIWVRKRRKKEEGKRKERIIVFSVKKDRDRECFKVLWNEKL